MAERKRKQNTVKPAKTRAKAKSRALLIFYCLVFLGVVVGAVLLCIFVFFKVSKVNISGTTVYSSEQLVEAAGIRSGDNLVFLDTDAVEQKLFSAFPYVEKVRVKKQLPSTVDINVIEAAAAYSVEHSGGYVYVSGQGKILEVANTPKEGSIVLKAGEVGDNKGYLSLATEELQGIFSEILTVFAGRTAGGVTEIDLTSIHNLSIVYDGRITLKLGSAADLTYKINFGLQIIDSNKIEADARGVLDLSLAKDSNKAYFSLETLASPAPGAGTTPGTDEPGEAPGDGAGEREVFENETPEDGGASDGTSEDAPEPASSRESTRGNDIPDV